MQWLEDNIEGLSDYKIKGVIGEGTFSIVYKAVDVNHDWYDNYAWSNQPSVPPLLSRDNTLTSSKVYVALKRIYVTSSPDRILNELEIMAELRSCANISYLITAFRSEDQVIAVMPYARHRDFRVSAGQSPYTTCYVASLIIALLLDYVANRTSTET